ncbi:hypothetical protein Y032_0572g140 [Ancylostoma ceylanicum]|uniref:Uncharacterized protein n=1 Tax=Ancylostoma ceylanicum TaxID=53326 RepID=A0A016WNX0_9BILA|nr:hypothetical protein Y032_0572g140 [Ancylostoma ceylanicum]
MIQDLMKHADQQNTKKAQIWDAFLEQFGQLLRKGAQNIGLKFMVQSQPMFRDGTLKAFENAISDLVTIMRLIKRGLFC